MVKKMLILNIQLFGGRGASSGISVNGKKYGTEYRTVLKSGNIKFVVYNDSTAAKTPMETMTKGRVYATVNSKNELHAITYYDKNLKRAKQIDLTHYHGGLSPHTHHGYFHDENGTTNLTAKERNMVDRIQKIWNNYNRSK